MEQDLIDIRIAIAQISDNTDRLHADSCSTNTILQEIVNALHRANDLAERRNANLSDLNETLDHIRTRGLPVNLP